MDLYEFKKDLFDNGKPEEFLLFIWNFQMTLEAKGALAASTKIQYMCTLLCVKSLHKLDTFSFVLGSTTTTYLNCNVLDLGTYFFLLMSSQKEEKVMRRGMRKPCKLKVRRYAAHMIKINEYLDVFLGAKASEKVGDTELNEILLNIIPNFWISQAYVQGFYCGYVTF